MAAQTVDLLTVIASGKQLTGEMRAVPRPEHLTSRRPGSNGQRRRDVSTPGEIAVFFGAPGVWVG